MFDFVVKLEKSLPQTCGNCGKICGNTTSVNTTPSLDNLECLGNHKHNYHYLFVYNTPHLALSFLSIPFIPNHPDTPSVLTQPDTIYFTFQHNMINIHST